MSRDLFLAIPALDAYNRGHAKGLIVAGTSSGRDKAEVGRIIDNTTIASQDISDIASDSGFYALTYDWNSEKIVSCGGTDGRNDVTKGWTIGAGWTDRAQADLAVDCWWWSVL